MPDFNEQVNYIVHLEGFFQTIHSDERLNPWHISLYFALFQIWNNVRFKEDINIRREELMSLSKIGSANTYTRCLKELDQWGYIKYTPSKSRFISSKVHMYRFDTTPNKTHDTSCDNTSDNTPVHLVRPFLNNNKHIVNNINNNKQKGSKDESHTSHTTQKTQKRFSPPPIDHVIDFFKEKKSTTQNAQMFYNHFQSNGWKVGGKTKMKDWKAAARNWILRSENFANQKSPPSSNRLNVEQNKDYDIPL